MSRSQVILSAALFFIFFQFAQPQNILREIMSEPPPVFLDAMRGDGHSEAKMLAKGLFDHVKPYFEIYSAKRNQFAGTIDGDFYLRNENSEAYIKRLKSKEGWYWHIDNAMWSPNGKYIIAKQINDTTVPTIKLTHSDPKDISYKTYSRAGDNIPIHQFYIIDLDTWHVLAVSQSIEKPYVHVLDWHTNSNNVFIVESDRLMKDIHLINIDRSTGESKVILRETSKTYLIGLNLLQGYSNRLIDKGFFTFLKDREQFIWLSERSGFYKMYLYDYEGNLIRPLTNGIFEQKVAIDLEGDWLYYTTHSDSTKPHALQVYRTSLKEDKIQKLSDIEGVTDVFMSKTKDSLLVLRSALPTLMQMDAFTTDGVYLETTWKGNISAIANGYFDVDYPKVLAADNKTVLETLLLKPKDFDASKKYPIVEYIYGGNFTNVVPHNLLSPILWQMQDLANSGFIVVFIDGRGTPNRGRDFRNFSYGKIGQLEIQDHVAALKQIGKANPFIDMNNIGVIGHSWGGHFALRAMIEAPDFYKAGHLNAAALDPVDFRIAVEAFMGCLPQDCPEKYEQSKLSNKLNNLKGPLMIVHGTADDDVPIEEAHKLVGKLKALNYPNYQFIEYQGFNHIVMRHPKWKPTMIDFFVQTLKNNR